MSDRPSQVVTIDVEGIVLDRPALSMLALLQTQSTRLEARRDGHVLVRSSQPLFWSWKLDGATQLSSVKLPYGLLPALPALYGAIGQALTVNGELPAVRPITELEQNTPLLSFLLHHRLGTIRCGSGEVLADAICAICLAFQDANIAICCASKPRAEALRVQLRERNFAGRLPNVSQRAGQSDGVLIGTSTPLWRGAERRHIVLYDGTAGMRGRCAADLYRTSRAARKFVMLRSDDGQVASENAQCRSWFGFAELRLTQVASQVRPIATIQHRVTTQNNNSPGLRQPISAARNGHRNRLIAQLARQLAGESSASGVTAPRIGDVVSGNPENRRITVLVDSPEQAAGLCQRLPGWPVLASSDLELRRLRSRDQSVLRRRLVSDHASRVSIVTLAAAAALNWADTDVIVRADTTLGLPPIADTALATEKLDPAPLVVVDVSDRGTLSGRQAMEIRAAAYRAREWFPLGADSAQERLNQFVATLLRSRAR